MVPVLPPGTIIWATRWFRRLDPGDVVILAHNEKEKIKRIDRLDQDRVFVVGDHPETSTDSRHFGWLGRDMIVAKLVWPRGVNGPPGSS